MSDRERLERLLDERLDGNLGEAEQAQLDAALAGDPQLARKARQLEELVEDLRTLPQAVEPPRDLWPQIERRTVASSMPRGRSRLWLAAAAMVCALGLAFLIGRWTGETGPRPQQAVVEPAETQEIVSRPAALAPDLAPATQALEETRSQLRRAFAERRAELPPATLELVEQNLATIERAISEIERAIAAHPSDRDLGKILVAYQTREIALLQQAQRAAARL